MPERSDHEHIGEELICAKLFRCRVFGDKNGSDILLCDLFIKMCDFIVFLVAIDEKSFISDMRKGIHRTDSIKRDDDIREFRDGMNRLRANFYPEMCAPTFDQTGVFSLSHDKVPCMLESFQDDFSR